MRTTGAIWVVPDSMARTTDPAFDRLRKSDYFAVGTTPYCVAREPDRAAVEAAWRDAGSGAGEMAILTLAGVPTAEAGESELDTLAPLAIDIVIDTMSGSRSTALTQPTGIEAKATSRLKAGGWIGAPRTCRGHRVGPGLDLLRP